jgi:hypothetical protein
LEKLDALWDEAKRDEAKRVERRLSADPGT